MQIYKNQDGEIRKYYLLISIIVNLGLLGFFKYWNFFVESIVGILDAFGLSTNMATLNIILPVGISFYTFQTMTYNIDIYRSKLEPTYDFLDFALFVSFFPQLVAGPIERAGNLLPQIRNKRTFNQHQMYRGVQLIFWGLFKKVFVADNLGVIVDGIYGNPAATGAEYIIATWAFAFQIYGDFSGYSDIARGTAKCFGIELMHNFKQPYFACNPTDLWRRWHISLSSWLRDYLYIPLGGNRKGKGRMHVNLLLTMLLGGLWHGAAWNFIIWGAYHGVVLCIHKAVVRDDNKIDDRKESLFVHLVMAGLMFQVTCLGWIFFRAESLDQIVHIVGLVFSSLPNVFIYRNLLSEVVFYLLIPLIVMNVHFVMEVKPAWFGEEKAFSYLKLSHILIPVRSAGYGVLTYLLCLYGAKAQSFIYFQF